MSRTGSRISKPGQWYHQWNGATPFIARLSLTASLAILAAASLDATGADAQSVGIPPPPTIQMTDQNGVELISGSLVENGPSLSIGTSDSGMLVARKISTAWAMGEGSGYTPFEQAYSYVGVLNHYDMTTTPTSGVPIMTVSYDGVSENYQLMSNGTYQPYAEATGTFSCSGNMCTYVRRDGTVILYDKTISYYTAASGPMLQARDGSVRQVTKPDGEVLTFSYLKDTGVTGPTAPELIAVSSSLGWMLKRNPAVSFGSYQLINTSAHYCGALAANCNSLPYPTVTAPSDAMGYSWGGFFAVSGGGNYNPVTLTYSTPSGVTTLASKSCDYTCATGDTIASDKITQIQRGNTTWNYTYQRDSRTPTTDNGLVDVILTNTTTGQTRTWVYAAYNNNLVMYTDELGRHTQYQADAYHDVLAVVHPDATYSSPPADYLSGAGYSPTGGETLYNYDSRQNLIQETVIPLNANGNTALYHVSSAVYQTSCSITVDLSCNEPLSVTDARNNTTTYTYDSRFGGVLTQTGPADSNGVQPQTRYQYSQLSAQILNSNSQLVASTPVWRLTRKSSCQTAVSGNPASCVGTAAETVTTYAYNSNNLLLTSVTVAAGDGSASSTTSYSYDIYGNQTVVDGPRTDVDDRSYATYDAARRKVFEIGVDPDGSGPLPRVVIHHMYDADGREYRTETGTGNATDGSDFAIASYVLRSYDPATGLLVKTITATVP